VDACREEVRCDALLLTVDRQIGLNVVHPDGKEAATVFERVWYDARSDTSVVRCAFFSCFHPAFI
jgi:tRNA pseudouridine synthase 9